MQPLINSVSYKLGHRSLGLLLVRVAAGLVFLMHGWSKVNNLPGVEGMFMHMGLGGPTGIFIAWLEVIGGLCLILGVLPRVFGFLFGIEMLVALIVTNFPANGYQPHEAEIFLMLVSFGIMFAGSGRLAIWSGECRRCGAYMCKMGPDRCPEMQH